MHTAVEKARNRAKGGGRSASTYTRAPVPPRPVSAQTAAAAKARWRPLFFFATPRSLGGNGRRCAATRPGACCAGGKLPSTAMRRVLPTFFVAFALSQRRKTGAWLFLSRRKSGTWLAPLNASRSHPFRMTHSNHPDPPLAQYAQYAQPRGAHGDGRRGSTLHTLCP